MILYQIVVENIHLPQIIMNDTANTVTIFVPIFFFFFFFKYWALQLSFNFIYNAKKNNYATGNYHFTNLAIYCHLFYDSFMETLK